MRQQINLYQPIFRGERKLFSSTVVGLSLGAVCVVLLGTWAYGSREVEQLAAQVAAMRTQQQSNDTRMASLGALQGARANPDAIQSKTASLTTELAARTQALQALQGGAVGGAAGFAARLEALARSRVEGLWLDHVILASNSAAMSLSGGTLNPDLVPQYLRELASQPVLKGARFEEFVIEGQKPAQAGAAAKPPMPGLRFRAGSSVTDPVKPENKT